MKDKLIINGKYMLHAIEEAKRAAAEGEIPVGAVVVLDGKVISSAHNLVEALGDASAHAELLALRDAAKRLGRRRLNDCELYVSLEPCPMCMGAILNFRLGAVCFGAYDDEAGCAVSRCELGKLVNYSVSFVGGVCEAECAALLRDFFEKKRVEGKINADTD